ncbi:MAG: GNAT family N-acetyltransferase [Enterococcus sp.]
MYKRLDKQNLPWELLLEADPEKKKVTKYIDEGAGFIWEEAGEVLGILVFITRDTEFEIMNVSVAPSFQGQGIGGKLLDYAIEYFHLVKQKQRCVIIRTGSVTSKALHLYQKKGFVEVSREKDYFIHNYKEPIYEDGVLLRDQVTLEKQL